MEFTKFERSIFFAIGVSVVVALAGIFLFVQYESLRQPRIPRGELPPRIVSPPSGERPNDLNLSDWQTYRNEEFGFEVRYPTDWKQDNQISSVHFERQGKRNTAVEIGITSGQAIREACKTLLELNPQEEFMGRNAIFYTKIQDMTIDGIPAIRFSGKLISGAPEIPPFRYQEEVMVCKENNIFSFALLIPSIAQEDEIAIFNQILSTFRFIP